MRLFEELAAGAVPVSGLNQSAESSADVVLMMNKLSTNPEFASTLAKLKMPTDKYKAIVKFANLLGIPDERLIDFIQQQQNLQQHDQGS